MKTKNLVLLILLFTPACWVGCDREESFSHATSSPTAQAVVPPKVELPPRVFPDFSRDVVPLLDRYCMGCHDREGKRGGVVLEGIRQGSADDSAYTLLLRVAENLRSENMPPSQEPQPNEVELEVLNAWLDKSLATDVHPSSQVVLRRLNRVEYNNTIRDLTGLDLHLADEFPSDDIGYGFDNIGEVLSTPPVLVEMYLAAADRAIGEAFQSSEFRQRILNPPVDAMPRPFRKFKAPVRTPLSDKRFGLPKVVEDPELKKEQRIYDILRAFGDRAFRRPAEHEELMRLLAVVLSAERDGESFETSIQLALRGILSSSHFLYRAEQVYGRTATVPENDFALAARLSYFLWSSTPDATLLHLASLGALRQGSNLRAQVERMLRDPRSRALASNFGSQWLETRKLSEFSPDPALFPDFDVLLQKSMLQETELFFASIKDEDRSVLEFLDANYTFVNDRLAKHYGIPGVSGASFRRVSLADTSRAGILTHASVLAVTSNPTRTSPVKRGKWILTNVLGTPPAPPPAGVEALKEEPAHAASSTLRQQMEQHRSNPACASCHRRMDPLGFGLENFDAIGAWRTHDGKTPVDASGEVPGVGAFHGPAELRRALATRRGAFLRCLAEKMLTYALGRGLQRADRRDVDLIVAKLTHHGFRFSALVLAVAESEAFQAAASKDRQP